jgi:hypothetical protein
MQTTTLSCPSCNAILRLGKPVDPGKKVRCPKCDMVFPVPDEDAAVHDRSDPPLSGRRRSVVEDDGHPADDYPDRSLVRNRRPADEYDRRAEADDRPFDDEDSPRPRRSARKIKKQVPVSNGVKTGLLIGGMVLFLGVGAIAAWVWPGFLKFAGVPAGTGKEDLLAYLPADCPFFMGADIDKLQAEMGNAFPLNQGWGGNPVQVNKPDKMVLAFRFQPPANFEMVIVMRAKTPYKEEEMRASFQGKDRQTAHGKVFYKVNMAAFNQALAQLPPGFNKNFLVGMPNDRIVILGNIPPSEMEALLAADGTKPKISGEAQALIQEVDQSTFWFVLHVNDSLKKLMAQNPQGGFAALGPGVNGIADALTRMKGLSGAFSLAGKLNATLSLTCADAGDALKVTNTIAAMWDKDGKNNVPQIVQAVRFMGSNDLAQAVGEACNSLKFTSNGAKAQVSLTVSKSLLEKAFKDLQRLGQMGGNMGGMNGPPNMGGPPNVRPIRRPIGPPKLPGNR